jgi:hypothetical protein
MPLLKTKGLSLEFNVLFSLQVLNRSTKSKSKPREKQRKKAKNPKTPLTPFPAGSTIPPMDEYDAYSLGQTVRHSARRVLRQLFAFWGLASILLFMYCALILKEDFVWFAPFIMGAPFGAVLWAMYRILRFTFGR